ncbi:aspartate/glutamate racemase family protein [Psychroserpens mesophilus]|uniref:aspartate/glutamate racemase family protein n=1 Tax=Psychroserpens mesophilus TaxID=325473 RepID=UPI003F492DB7
MKNLPFHTCILGLGERSTTYYLTILHKKYYEKLGEYHTFPFLMYQIDFDAINRFLPNQFDKLIPELTSILDTISKFNAKQYLIPNITLHETLDQIDHHLHFAHPVQLAITYCLSHDIDKIVLFGSRYTMSSNYIPKMFKAKGLSIIKPSEEDQLLIDHFRTKTYASNDTESDYRSYKQLIQKYTSASHVITACTELSLHHVQLKNSKVIDMALLQIEKVLTQDP